MKMLLLLFLAVPGFAGTHIMQGDAAGGDLSGTYPNPSVSISSSSLSAGSTNYIQNRNTLQSGATFYVSSGSVAGQFTFAGNKLPSTQSSGHDKMLYFNDGVANFGDAPGFSMVDNTLYTVWVTSFNPTGGVYNDTFDVLNTSAAAAYRMTRYRGQHVNLRDSLGVEIGTSSAPVMVRLSNPASSTATIAGVVGTLSAQQSSVTRSTFTTNTSTLTLDISLYSNISLEINGTYGNFTAVFEGSVDSATYATLQGARSDSAVTESGPSALTNITRIWNIPVAGYQTFRFRTTNLGSGSVIVNAIASGDNYTPGVTANQASPANLRASVSIDGSSNTVKFSGSTATIQGIAYQYDLPVAVSTGAAAPAFSDKFGRQMVSGIPREQIRQATATVTSTTEFVFISSGAAGVYNDLCGCLISNTSSVSTRVDFRGQGNGGIINTNIQVPGTDVRGFWPGCQNPMVQLTPASNWTVQISTATTDIRVACQYIPMK